MLSRRRTHRFGGATVRAVAVRAARFARPEGLSGPGTARGLALDRSFNFGAVDQINTFTGNLSVQLPLGDSYAVNGGLSYGLVLSYNALVWDHGTAQHPTLGEIRTT